MSNSSGQTPLEQPPLNQKNGMQWLELGRMHLAHEDVAAALAAFAQAHAARPQDPETSFLYAQTLVLAGRTEEAAAVLDAAQAAQPGDTNLLRLAIEVWRSAGDLKRAITCAQRLEAAAPHDPLARVISGRLWIMVANRAAAVAAFEAALALDPACRTALDGLADIWRLEGENDKARAVLLRRAAAPDTAEAQAAARFKAATIQPVVAHDVAEMDAAREALRATLEKGPETSFADPWSLGLGPSFYLGYQARNDRPLQEAQAAYFLAATPSLAFSAPHVGRTPGARIKVGIISHFLTKHTVGYLTLGLVKHLDRSRFDLVLFRTPGGGRDSVTQQFAAAAPIVDLPQDIAAAQAVIAKADLDVLHYPEIGMDHFSYFLGFARLATVQTMAWGHPITSGLPAIDMFLTVDGMEPPGAEAHYRERLVRLAGLSFSGARPQASDLVDTFIDQTRPAYVCAQTLFKAHPDFDATVAKILAQDAKGLVYFIGYSAATVAIFRERLAKICGRDIARVKILPRMNGRQFLALVAAADVLLDIPQWSGGKTSLEALALGTPIVHQPGAFMRGRHTFAFYRRMGMSQMIADSPDVYAELAVRAACDAGFRREVRGEIAARSGALFDDIVSIREIEGVWTRALT